MSDAVNMLYIVQPLRPGCPNPYPAYGYPLYFEAVAFHTDFIPRHQVGAFFLGVVRAGEEHALIAFSLLIQTDTARLYTYIRFYILSLSYNLRTFGFFSSPEGRGLSLMLEGRSGGAGAISLLLAGAYNGERLHLLDCPDPIVAGV